MLTVIEDARLDRLRSRLAQFVCKGGAARHCCALVCCTILLWSAALHAQEWPRLPDGRVVITVNDVSLALPSDGSDLDDIHFNAEKARMSLRQAIAFPDQARRFFAEKEVRYVSIPNLEERTNLFLGRFNRKPLFGFRFSIGLVKSSLTNCRYWLQANDRYRERLISDHTPVDANGWGEFVSRKSPKTWHYVRAEDLSGVPKHFDSFACNSFGFCTATTCVGSKASFIYRFSRKIHKREDWNDVVHKAADVFHFLFDIDNTAGGTVR